MNEENAVQEQEILDDDVAETSNNSSDSLNQTEKSIDRRTDNVKNDVEQAKPEEEKFDGAPDTYAEFDVPEGIELDTEQMSRFKEFGQTHNLSQKSAQELVELHLQTMENFTTRQMDQWDEVKENWVNDVRADKDLQDDTGSTDAAIATALKAVENLGGQDLKEALELTGAGSHPAVVKAFYQMGKAMEEDKVVFGGAGADNRSAADVLYPTMRKSK